MLKVFTLDNSEKWDEIVDSFDNTDIYYLSGYVNAFNVHGDGEPLLFYYSDSSTKAINVVMKRDISNLPPFMGLISPKEFYDLSTPYGYGGWIIEGPGASNVFKEYEKWCKHNNIVSEFVRFHPLINNHVLCNTFYSVIKCGKTVSLELQNKDEVWNNFSKKNRNVIRKSINNGVQVFHDYSPLTQW